MTTIPPTTVRLPPALRERLKAIAEADHRSVSTLIRIAVERYLAKGIFEDKVDAKSRPR